MLGKRLPIGGNRMLQILLLSKTPCEDKVLIGVFAGGRYQGCRICRLYTNPETGNDAFKLEHELYDLGSFSYKPLNPLAA